MPKEPLTESLPRVPQDRITTLLERQLCANPTDSMCQLYADWLISMGHPLGELIHRFLADCDPKSWLEENEETLLDPLARYRSQVEIEYDRGFFERVEVRSDTPKLGDLVLQALFGHRGSLLMHTLCVPDTLCAALATLPRPRWLWSS